MAHHKDMTGCSTAHSIQKISYFPENSDQILHPFTRFPISAWSLPQKLWNLTHERAWVLSVLTGLINY